MASRRLILMRHAKSSWKFDVADKERPLNSRGRKSAAGVAEELARLGRIPSLVLSSDARRTRETLELMNLKGSESKFLPSFYGIFGKPATSVIMEQVWKHAARGHEGTMEEPNTVMVLGHNAGWELALNDLVGPLAVPLVMSCRLLRARAFGGIPRLGVGGHLHVLWQVEGRAPHSIAQSAP